METEGVVQYRLLGSHPAASGRHHSFGFSGDTVAVAALTQDIVKRHQINLTRYKLEVQRIVSAGGENEQGQAANTSVDVHTTLQQNDELRSYDRVVVTVSRRHYLDGVAAAAQEEQKAREKRLQYVEGMLREDEVASAVAGCSKPAAEGKQAEAQDLQAMRRVTAVSGKAFPLLPWLRNRRSMDRSSLPTPEEGVCVLCELETFNEVVLECCGFFVCAPCLELARTMTQKEATCAVCGGAPEGKSAVGSCYSGPFAVVKRERSGSDLSGVSSASCQLLGRLSSVTDGGRCDTRVASVGGAQPRMHRTASMVSALEKELDNNMAHILSLLDTPDPLTAEAKANRKMSELLMREVGR